VALCSLLAGSSSSLSFAEEPDALLASAREPSFFQDLAAPAWRPGLLLVETPAGGADSVTPPPAPTPAPVESTGTSDGRRAFADDHEGYQGGRGLITLEGISGMFLNPTSGTLPARSLTAQYCVAILERNERTEYQHTAMVSYGVFDWLELGVLGRITDPAENPTVGGGGPLARLRFLKDDGWLPELSAGGMIREGNDRIDKQTVFVAASKRFPFVENPFRLGSVRLHGGFRQIWQNSEVNEANGSIFYGGVEVEFPYDLWLVGELSNKTDVFNHQPYAFGAQWRPTDVLGLSVAGVQTGGDDQVSLFVGIGGTVAF
jgi:hypothetical protein